MALKFRRGTTAQKSGSLAFGEPYVNTTLGTLQIGGDNGDITLLINSSSQGISGSSLDITGNAKIDGNLTLGGNITIGDNTSDTVTVTANLSSSLIPSVTNTFDLGSSDKIWRDLYLSTGSIKLVDGGGNIVNTITNANIVTTDAISSGSVNLASSLPIGVVSGSSQITLQSTTGFTAFNTALATITGSLISSASADKISITNINSTTASLNTSVSNINSFTSSINTTIKSKLDTDGVISGSSQVTLSSTTGFTSYSSSVDSRILTEKGRVDAILLAADADKDSFAEIVTLINSVDTTNDNAFASFYTSSVGRLNNLESTSASVETRLTEIGVVSGSLIATASNHEQRLDTFESISGSFAKTNESNTFGNDQIISGNISLTGRVTAGLAVSASGLNINKADGNVQIELANSTTGRGFHLISYNGDSFSIHNPTTGLSSFRIDSGSTGYHSHFFGDVSVLSGSIIVSNGITGSIAATNGVVSGSSQITLQSTTGFTSFDSALSTITGSLIVSASTAKTTNDTQDTSISNLNSFSSSQLIQNATLATYTASVETRLTEIGVVSGSLIISASTAKTTNDSQDVSISNLNSYTSSLKSAIQLTGSTVSFLGNIVVYGTQSVINSENLAINDNLIYLNEGSTITNPDLGIVGNYNDGTYGHAGIFRDASDGGAWKVFEGYTLEPSGTIDTTGNGFTLADFKADVITATSFNGQINATNGVVSGSSQVIGILSSLNSYTASNDTTNTTQNSRLDQLSTASGSAITRLTALEVETSNLESFTSSINTTIKNKLDADGVISSSAQLTATFDSRYLNTNSDGVVSGSSQIDATATTNWATGIKTQLNSNTVVSGSSQINLGSASGNIALSSQTTGDYVASLVAGAGVTITNNSGEGATPTIAIGQAVATSSSPTFAGLTINGAITATGDITAYYSSDKRYKNNIQPITDALAKVRALNGVTWEWNDDVSDVTKAAPKTGLIAQEVQSVLPEVVKEKEDGYLGLDYAKMMGLMVEAIKEQQLQIDKLTLKVAELEKQKGL